MNVLSTTNHMWNSLDPLPSGSSEFHMYIRSLLTNLLLLNIGSCNPYGNVLPLHGRYDCTVSICISSVQLSLRGFTYFSVGKIQKSNFSNWD